ncbi:MAG TPA: SDR family NAD(P)-dependent oxidoreductase, partial [Acidimicrobiales bacterium]|nr:SDR family NAD(P)-dependent oxidoreductase [Acidimicrobiales bacterium]
GAGTVECCAFDAADPPTHDAALDDAWRLAGGDVDVVVVAFGVLGDQAHFESGPAGRAAAVEVATVNYVGGVSAGLGAAERLRRQGHGTLVVLSSVAGERVRRANYVYGSTKAALDGFAQGLGDALAGSGVSVLVVRPGFVHGRMTAGMPPAPMATTVEAVATATVAALRDGRQVVWVPGGLRWVFAVLRHLPRPLWRRMPG